MHREAAATFVPRLARVVLTHCLPRDLREPVIGDFEELYTEEYARRGQAHAALWYCGQTLQSVVACRFGALTDQLASAGSSLAAAARALGRQRVLSTLIMAGLTVAFACGIVVSYYVAHELRFDRYHDDAARVYRLGAELSLGGTPNAIASTNAPPALAMVEEFPEVERSARVRPMGRKPVRYGDRHFYEERMLYADASIFDVFSFPMIRGNPETALADAYSIVLTLETAEKYFGGRDPLGKTLIVNHQAEFTVTGIVENVRSDSHFVFDMLCSLETLYDGNREQMEAWFSPFVHYSYVVLAKDANPAEVERKLEGLVDRHVGDSAAASGASLAYFLQPLTRIHLHSRLRHELAPNGNFVYVCAFAFVALSILLIASLNFVNLMRSRAAVRIGQVGAGQVLAESLLYSLISMIVALVLAHSALPLLGDLLAAESVALSEGIGSMAVHSLGAGYGEQPWLVPSFVGLALLIGLLAGRRNAVAAVERARFRRVLVAAQLAVSVALIIATSLVIRQLAFLQTVPVGFDKERVAVIPIADRELRASIPSIENELRQLDGVISTGASSHAPGQRPSGGSYAPGDYPAGETEMMDRMSIDDTCLETLGMEIVAGRGFSEEFPADETESILINETAARKFGWRDPLGKTISLAGTGQSKTVVGVVKDFHFSSPHRLIAPIYIDRQPARFRSILVKVESDGVAATIERLREAWSGLDPNRPFDYYFLDTAYDRQFQAEANLSKVFGTFTLMAILITCLGLFGISFVATGQRNESAGVRPITARDMVVLSLAANLLAWPCAYGLMRGWLQDFPHRVEMSSWPFALAALVMLALGLTTAAYRPKRALGDRRS